MSKFIIAQKSSEEQKVLLDITGPNKIAYAKRYGYEVCTDCSDYNRNKLDKWMKIEAILRAFDLDGDWIFWSDADSLIMNYDISLESFLPEEDVHLMMAFFHMNTATRKVMSYDHPYILHAGNMFIRRSNWAYDFLIDCYQDDNFSFNLMSEEAAITHRYRTDPEVASKIKVLKLDRVCSIPPHPHEDEEIAFLKQYTDGDFILHMLGYNMSEKIKGLRRYADRASVKNE